jgi:acetyl esterase/lipase
MSGFTLQGKTKHKLRSYLVLLGTTLKVVLRRAIGKNVVPEWKWGFEVSMLFWREQMIHAFSLPTIEEAREHIDSLEFKPTDPLNVEIYTGELGKAKGHWFIPPAAIRDCVLLYFHGGGYAYYTKSHQTLIAYIAQAVPSRTFALDYRLTPEHPHPAQLEDAIGAYRQLIGDGISPGKLVVAGDSAGGHLALSLLPALRDARLPQPALAIGICPWTDIGRRGASLFGHDRYDWVQGYMALKFGEWLKGDTQISDAELSPICCNFRGLAPIYLQAGGREILFDMICDFETTVREQGADVTLDVWANMTHDFQGFGSFLPESQEALERLGMMIRRYCGSLQERD